MKEKERKTKPKTKKSKEKEKRKEHICFFTLLLSSPIFDKERGRTQVEKRRGERRRGEKSLRSSLEKYRGVASPSIIRENGIQMKELKTGILSCKISIDQTREGDTQFAVLN